MSSTSHKPTSALQTPVLLLAFNRPDTTQRVFDAIRQAAPTRLYVAVDGPRPDRPGEAATVRSVRELVTDVDWDCKVKTLFRDENLGCRTAVSSAIDWFFEHEPAGIILEDDCLPHPSFFRFCGELLQHYADDSRIMTISGNNFQRGRRRSEHSYYFSRYMHCWGWATWRWAWQHYDRDLSTWPRLRDSGWMETRFPHARHARYWRDLLDRVAHGDIDSWAYIWQYSIWTLNGVNILPDCNLVSNIGFDTDATHTTKNRSPWANLPTQAMPFPLRHPAAIARDEEADLFTQRTLFRPPGWASRLRHKIRQYI